MIKRFGNVTVEVEVPNPIPEESKKAGDQDWTNWYFIKAFDKFQSFEEMANFVQDFFKGKKNKG